MCGVVDIKKEALRPLVWIYTGITLQSLFFRLLWALRPGQLNLRPPGLGRRASQARYMEAGLSSGHIGISLRCSGLPYTAANHP